MGEFAKPEFAYMFPVRDGKAISEPPSKPFNSIYKIRVEQMPAFLEQFAINGLKYATLYQVYDATEHPDLQPKVAAKPDHSKTCRSRHGEPCTCPRQEG